MIPFDRVVRLCDLSEAQADDISDVLVLDDPDADAMASWLLREDSSPEYLCSLLGREIRAALDVGDLGRARTIFGAVGQLVAERMSAPPCDAGEGEFFVRDKDSAA